MNWYNANQGTIQTVLIFLVIYFIPNVFVARRTMPLTGKFAGFWWVMGRAAFLCFKNAQNTVKWPGEPPGPQVMTLEDAARRLVNAGAAAVHLPSIATPPQSEEDTVVDSSKPPEIPRLLPGRKNKVIGKIGILLLVFAAACMTGCGAAGSVLGITANGLGIVVNRADVVYAARYRTASNAVMVSPEFVAAAKISSKDAMTLYEKAMAPWDDGVTAIRGARAAVFAVGTAAGVTVGADRVPAVVKSLAYATGIAIGMVQTLGKQGVNLQPDVISSLQRACIFTTSLARGAGIPDAAPKACETVGK